MKSSHKDYSNQVEAWAKQVTQGLSSEQLIQLIDQSLAALWKRSRLTFSTVLIMAVWERVIFSSLSGGDALFASLKVTEDGINLDEFRQVAHSLNELQLVEILQSLITEYIVILGSITNDVIRPALFHELLQIELESKAKTSRNPNGEGK